MHSVIVGRDMRQQLVLMRNIAKGREAEEDGGSASRVERLRQHNVDLAKRLDETLNSPHRSTV